MSALRVAISTFLFTALMGLMGFTMFKGLSPQDYFEGVQLTMMNAALAGEVQRVAQAQRDGADVNALGSKKMLPLTLAILTENRGAITLLLKAGADPGKRVDGIGNVDAITASVFAALS